MSSSRSLNQLSIDLNNNCFPEKYFISSELGEGAFGKTYMVSPSQNPSNFFAAKFVPLSTTSRNKDFTQLEKEADILQTLYLEPGFPKLQTYRIESQNEVLVMSLLGKNLKALLKQCGGGFSIKTLALLALQILRRIKVLHEKGLLHRDIKPENIVMGNNEKDAGTVYLIDFGLATPYRDIEGRHLPFSKKNKITGTLHYLSVFGHLGIQPSRRDDLISLGYMLVFLMKGELPWTNLKGDIQEKVKTMFQMKSCINFEGFCKRLPEEFCEYLKCVSSLPFNQKPNYEYFEGLFKRVLMNLKTEEDGAFDWMKNDGKGIDLKGRKIMEDKLDKYMKLLEKSDSFLNLEFE